MPSPFDRAAHAHERVGLGVAHAKISRRTCQTVARTTLMVGGIVGVVTGAELARAPTERRLAPVRGPSDRLATMSPADSPARRTGA